MKSKRHLFLFILMLFVLNSCVKKEPWNVYFYVKSDTSNLEKTLFIDGNMQSVLPVHSNSLSCNSDSLIYKTFPITLSNGRYKLEVKGLTDNSLSTFKITLRDNKISSSGTNGNSNSFADFDSRCCVIEFAY